MTPIEHAHKSGLEIRFKELTRYLETFIYCRDNEVDKQRKIKYRKLAKSLEKSLTALENAINIIGE